MPAIFVRPSQANKLLGLELDFADVKDIFERLQIKIVKEQSDGFIVIPPAYRFDLEREVDLIEEIVRIYGYDQVPVTAARISDPEVIDEPEVACLRRLRDTVMAYGYNEAVNYSFIDPEAVAALQFAPESRFYDFVHLRRLVLWLIGISITSILIPIFLKLYV